MRRSHNDEVYAVARDRAGLTCSKEEFVDAFCDIFWPNPPMVDLIPRLKASGYRLVLASNTNEAHYNAYREAFSKDTPRPLDAISVSHRSRRQKAHQVL